MLGLGKLQSHTISTGVKLPCSPVKILRVAVLLFPTVKDFILLLPVMSTGMARQRQNSHGVDQSAPGVWTSSMGLSVLGGIYKLTSWCV